MIKFVVVFEEKLSKFCLDSSAAQACLARVLDVRWVRDGRVCVCVCGGGVNVFITRANRLTSKIYCVLLNFEGGSQYFNSVFVGTYLEASRG